MRDGSWLDDSVDLALPDDTRVDQLAEWCYYVEALLGSTAPDFDTAEFLMGALCLADMRPVFEAIRVTTGRGEWDIIGILWLGTT